MSQNGIALREDVHTLFDQGYVPPLTRTVGSSSVLDSLRETYENGREISSISRKTHSASRTFDAVALARKPFAGTWKTFYAGRVTVDAQPSYNPRTWGRETPTP